MDHERSSVTEEVTVFLQEHPIKHKEDPLAWWQDLSTVFLIFLSWHAATQPYLLLLHYQKECSLLIAGIVVDKRRCALTAKMISALLFLHKNSYLFGLTDEPHARPEPRLLLLAQDSDDIEESDGEDDDNLSLLLREAVETEIQT